MLNSDAVDKTFAAVVFGTFTASSDTHDRTIIIHQMLRMLHVNLPWVPDDDISVDTWRLETLTNGNHDADSYCRDAFNSSIDNMSCFTCSRQLAC